jgi:hypothetical protein
MDEQLSHGDYFGIHRVIGFDVGQWQWLGQGKENSLCWVCSHVDYCLFLWSGEVEDGSLPVVEAVNHSNQIVRHTMTPIYSYFSALLPDFSNELTERMQSLNETRTKDEVLKEIREDWISENLKDWKTHLINLNPFGRDVQILTPQSEPIKDLKSTFIVPLFLHPGSQTIKMLSPLQQSFVQTVHLRK